MRFVPAGLLACCLIVVRSAANPIEFDPIDNSTDYRLPKATVPIHYDLQIDPQLDPARSDFDGRVGIDLELIETTDRLVLHSVNLTIDEPSTYVHAADGSTHKPMGHEYETNTDFLSLYFETPLRRGFYTLYFKFSGNMSDEEDGLSKTSYNSTDGRTLWLASTYIKTIQARRILPCFDEPALKATFSISIKHAPQLTAVSNSPMKERGQVDPMDGKLWTRFEKTPKISTYMFGFTIAELESCSNQDGSITIYHEPGHFAQALDTLALAEVANEKVANYLNRVVQLPKLSIVQLPAYFHWKHFVGYGLVIYRRPRLFEEYADSTMRSKMQDFSDKMDTISFITQQYLGSFVSIDWWDHAWLKFYLPKYVKDALVSEIEKEWHDLSEIYFGVRQSIALRVYRPRALDNLNQNITDPKHVTSYYYDEYKAASVLHMISKRISDVDFRAGLAKFLKRFAYRSASPDDLWETMQSATKNFFDVKSFASTWTDQPGFPLVTVKRNYKTSEIEMSQELLRMPKYTNEGLVQELDSEAKKENEKYVWRIPLSYVSQRDVKSASTASTGFVLDMISRNLSLYASDVRPEDWIIVNLQRNGYYRVNYDDTNWRMIAKFLNSKDYVKIDPLTRLELIDDAILMVMTDRMKFDTFFELINYLSQETLYMIMRHLFQMIEDYRYFFEMPPTGNMFKAYAIHLLQRPLDKLGFEGQKDEPIETTLYRMELLTTLCGLGHQKCREIATRKLREYYYSVDHNLPVKMMYEYKHWIYSAGIANADRTLWNRILREYNETGQSIYNYYLAQTQDPVILRDYLEMTITEGSPMMKNNETSYPFGALVQNREIIDVAINFVKDHSEELSKIKGNLENIVYSLRSLSVSLEQLYKIEAIMRAHNIKKTENFEIHENLLKWSKRIVRQIPKWLHKYVDSDFSDDMMDNVVQ